MPLLRTEEAVSFGAQPITVCQIVALARGEQKAELCRDPEFAERIESGLRLLEKLLEEDGVIYGVTTGYGDSCTVAVDRELVEELPLHLSRFHGCGLGRHLSCEASFATLAVRLASLSRGYSGVRLELLQRLVELLNHRIAPAIPEEGSVGASGDLTPLSYVAAALVGEREVYFGGELVGAAQALREAGLQPLTLRPKEALAIMNGTTVMTALGCLAYARAEYLTRLCSRITSLASLALKGNPQHFEEKLFALKPHPGQSEIAAWIRGDLKKRTGSNGSLRNSARLQDRYSVRCAPHVIGVLRDALPWMRRTLEVELNSVNDNPVIDGEEGRVLHGGHFYGGHVAFVMDSMKNCVANLADLLDRQLALLVDQKFNDGLPPNLSGSSGVRAQINHGFKAVQIGVSAWTAEALKNTMPASVFSRSTECHNQDKVSMGTIAARDCLRVLELTEQVAAAQLLAVVQALRLRLERQEVELNDLNSRLVEFYQQVAAGFPGVVEDRPLEGELRETVEQIRRQSWSLYE